MLKKIDAVIAGVVTAGVVITHIGMPLAAFGFLLLVRAVF